MSRSLALRLSCLLLVLLAATGSALAAQRQGDMPLVTSWSAYALGPEARSESGLSAKALAVLFLEPDKGWYTYSSNPGGLGKPTRLSASLGGAALQTLYPAGTPKPDPLEPGAFINAYAGRTPLFVLLPERPDGPAALTARLELLLCTTDKCLPASLDLAFSLPKGPLPEAKSQPWWPALLAAAKAGPAPAQALAAPEAQAPAQAQPGGDWSGLRPRYLQPALEVGGLLKAVLLGLLAGFILNFMPCVLPVISIKLSALMAGSTEADATARLRSFREHNLFFALGILLYFLFLSALLGATGLAWGQIFQQAEVVLLLCAFIFALALSLLGVFSLPVIDLKFDRMTTHPRLQALSTGLLATLLATPCSGPFLGGVLGWTLLQPAWVISTVLVAVGAGMALPYFVLMLFPGLARLLPRPGAWTGVLEQLVGLLLLATCVYLLSILPEARLLTSLVLLWFTGLAAWLWGLGGPGFAWAKTALLKLSAALALALGLFLGLQPASPPAHMDAYSDAALRAALGSQTVVVDFTADWCPSCKVLEQTVLTPARLRDMKERRGLLLLRADLTEKNPQAEALLQALGSKSIPLLAIFPKDAPDRPLVLRDLFTPDQLEEALKQTARP